ncbi:tetratricopeptide repeat protein [Candidatus Poribacteria bacterium]|nr:tetratricopeptide repeat protein [Candidatus Poribacteria bacterium]
MERIYQHYHKTDVEVMTIIPGVTDEYSRSRLPSFSQDYKASYTALDDPQNSVIALYALSVDLRTPQVLIIDKEGIVRHVGKSTPWTQMAEEIEKLRGKTEKLDLSSVKLAVQSLKNPDGYVRWKAAEALGNMKDETAVPALIEALSDEVDSVREFAAKALGEIGDNQSMEPLIDALEDKSNFVRMEAVKALEGIADERAVSPLVKLLKDSELRPGAANALAEIGKPELVDKALEENRAILQRGAPNEFAEVYSHLGRAYKERGMYDAAIAAYEKAAKRVSDSYRRGDYSRSLVECYMEAGEKEKAATEYLTMINSASAGGGAVTMSYGDGTVERFTEREWAIREFVDFYSGSGKLGELAEVLEAKLPESPKDLGLYETLGSIYERQNMNEKAISMYEKMVELQPRNTKYLARLASAYNRAGMADKSVAIAQEMAAKGGDASVMAKLFLELRMYDEAAAAYKKAISTAQGDWERRGYQLGLAKCFEDAGKYTEAVEEYEKIAKTSQDQYWRDTAERQLWDVYSKGNLYDVAIEKYQKMVEANPKDVKVHQSLARAYEGKGDSASAIAEYEEIIQIQPDNAQWYRTLGNLYQKPMVSGSISDSALSLDGDEDYIEIPYHESLSPVKQITVEVWVKPAALEGVQGLVFKKNDGPETGTVCFEEYALPLNNGQATWTLGKSNDTNVGASSQPLPVNQWVHLAGTYDGTELRLYVNSFLQATTSWLFGIENSTNPLTLGRLYGGTSGYQENYFTGELDEVRIWSVARTQQEIQANMNVKLTGNEPFLVGYWRFDETTSPPSSLLKGDGGKVTDSSPNKNDGKLVGDAKIVKYDRPIFAQQTPDKLAKAAEAYSKALELEPTSYELCLSLAQIYLQNEQYEQAANELKRVINRQDIFPDTYRGMWTSIVQAGKVVKDEARFIQFMQDLMNSMPADSTARLHANLALSTFYAEHNQLEEANKYLNKVGFVAESVWWIIGPFDNAGGIGHNKAYVPEDATNVDTTAEYHKTKSLVSEANTGTDGKVGWKKLQDEAFDGFVDFNQIFGGNLDWVTAYAWTTITSPDERQAQIHFGSDDQAKVWLNGKQVFAFDQPRTAAIDQDTIPVTLKAGENSLLIKVSDEQVNWGFYLRFTDMNGVPVNDIGLTGD